MQVAPLPKNEFTRAQALRATNILDTTSDIRFDLITRCASHWFNAPICAVSLIDTNRQWFKSVYGINISEAPRNISMCAHAINEVTSHIPAERIFEINNTVIDFRFVDNPYVIQSPGIRSYISFVIQSQTGENIGTFCVVDTRPRIFDTQEKRLLISLGQMLENLIHTYTCYSLTHPNHAAPSQQP